MFSDSCSYSNNTFENNGAGVAVMYTKNVQMYENHFVKNWGAASYGILLKAISDSRIEKNIFDENSIGLYMEGCSRVTIEQNNFTKNGWALKLMANSMDNYFYDTNFVANSFDISTNTRQNFNTFEQNYWAEYDDYDLNNDGYCFHPPLSPLPSREGKFRIYPRLLWWKFIEGSSRGGSDEKGHCR